MVVAAALASAPVLSKPLPFLTGEIILSLRDSLSGWMTAPYLFFLVNFIIIAILVMSRHQHKLDWTEYHAHPHDHSHGRVKEVSLASETGDHFQGRVKEISLTKESGDQFEGRVKETSLPNEGGDHFQGRVKETSLPNDAGDQFHGRVKEISLPNERGDHFQGKVKKIGLPNERVDHFQGAVKKISLPNERADDFEGRVNEISLPSETGEEEEVWGCCVSMESAEMCTKSRFSLLAASTETRRESAENLGSSVHGEDKMSSVGRFTSRRSKGKKMGQSLRVSHVEKDREETFESVWKKISEGRRPPLARHLRSGPQGIGSGRLHKAEGTEESALQMVLARGRSGGSAGQDELNKRVEAFITKFNRDIKLQKQDSLLGYADMIHRGAM
ncbi:hypothetical protein SUGI_0268480 [Cryptomeria japonica]|nr:hypothetical protein SUGI_0268480 [Cryptomeria japonica]